MRGLIRYTSTIAGAPVQGFYQSANPYGATATPWATVTAAVGQQIDVYLPYYMSHKEMSPRDNLAIAESKSGVAQSSWYGSIEGRSIVLGYVDEIREAGKDNPRAHLDAIAKAAGRGVVMQWFPDYDVYPNEYFSVRVKRFAPSRKKNSNTWTFRFDLTIQQTQQFPSTVPAFV